MREALVCVEWTYQHIRLHLCETKSVYLWAVGLLIKHGQRVLTPNQKIIRQTKDKIKFLLNYYKYITNVIYLCHYFYCFV